MMSFLTKRPEAVESRPRRRKGRQYAGLVGSGAIKALAFSDFVFRPGDAVQEWI
jgi:hypothetical protein